MVDASFDRLGDPEPQSPVILSVPHAGRTYPPMLAQLLRVPVSALRPLEDRHVDAVAVAARGACTAFVQRLPRAWIDLNRREDERDPAIDEGADRRTQPIASPKLRSGLGLVPRRASGSGELWRRPLTDDDVRARIDAAHRPYHAALAGALRAARARFGVAVLLDLHSMPSLGPPGSGAARVVVGDRFGRAAATRFVARVEGEALAARLPAALNVPYAGGYILDRHGAPGRGIHAIQLELDRALYLDRALDRPGTGLPATARFVTAAIAALEDEALCDPPALAAE